jgi:hypothetical protein
VISATNRWLGISFMRRRTRRWVVATYWVWVAYFSFLILRKEFRVGVDGVGAPLLVSMVVTFPAVLGGVRSGGAVKPFRGFGWIRPMSRNDLVGLFEQPLAVSGNLDQSDDDLDEREKRLRDRVHFLAHTLSRWFALLLFAVLIGLGVKDSTVAARVGPVFFFLMNLVLWSLPQSLILWNEPDIEEAGTSN